MAETVRKAEDKREVVLADGKPVLRDLAVWMNNQKTDKSNGKLIPLREEKLNSIGFVWDEKEYNWKVCLRCEILQREGGEVAETWKGRGQARGGVGRWQTSAEGLGKVDEQSKERQKQWQIDSTPGREVERDWLSISQ